MPPNMPTLYLDTCAILEAFRTKCWRQIVSRFSLHTVAECRQELEGGNPRDRKYVHVDLISFDTEVTIHTTTQEHRLMAQAKSTSFVRLDAGERDLLAWCVACMPSAIILTTGDRAAIVSACELGLGQNLQSLEEVADTVGARAELQPHFRKKWLSEIRTESSVEETIQ